MSHMSLSFSHRKVFYKSNIDTRIEMVQVQGYMYFVLWSQSIILRLDFEGKVAYFQSSPDPRC